jgi:hypothetical protein
VEHANIAIWFPIFGVVAAAPLFLYDRTAARKKGPLLQVEWTPEIRTTARLLSFRSIVWLTIGPDSIGPEGFDRGTHQIHQQPFR